MKLLIDIDEKLYQDAIKLVEYGYTLPNIVPIANGIPYCEADHTKELVNYLYENHVRGDLSIEDMAGDILNLTKGDLVDE